MLSINVTQRGSFQNLERYLNRAKGRNIRSILEKYGEKGVTALMEATPIDSSRTANSWFYEIVERPGYYSIRWKNSHLEDGRPIAILLQYGHGTRNGGYVQGRDYIMPAIRPVFDEILADVEREVIR